MFSKDLMGQWFLANFIMFIITPVLCLIPYVALVACPIMIMIVIPMTNFVFFYKYLQTGQLQKMEEQNKQMSQMMANMGKGMNMNMKNMTMGMKNMGMGMKNMGRMDMNMSGMNMKNILLLKISMKKKCK